MNNLEFIHARPMQKASMIEEGIEYIAWRADKLATELKVLNSWINQVPDIIKRGENISFDEAFELSRYQLKVSLDKFLDQVLLNREELNNLIQFLTKLQQQTL